MTSGRGRGKANSPKVRYKQHTKVTWSTAKTAPLSHQNISSTHPKGLCNRARDIELYHFHNETQLATTGLTVMEKHSLAPAQLLNVDELRNLLQPTNHPLGRRKPNADGQPKR
jgi:hypothetical protein